MMKSTRSIHTLAQSVRGNFELEKHINHQLWISAAKAGCLEDAVPPAGECTLCPARLHADFTRMLAGEPPRFAGHEIALQNLKRELEFLEFRPSEDRNRYVHAPSLGLVGQMDAVGEIDGYDAIVELKVVNRIDRIPKPADAAQLLLYDLAWKSQVGGTVLVALYLQGAAPFRAESRIIVNPQALLPLVHQLAA